MRENPVIPIEDVLDAHGIPFNPNRTGNQPLMCPNPEHDDAHPSASLNLDKQLWNCMGCGEGGSVVDLLMTLEGMSLREALASSEEGSATGGRQVPSQSGRTDLGLPAGKGTKRRTSSGSSPWAGFR